MSSTMANNKWRMVEEKKEVLRELVEERWKKEEWELAALGERTLRTVEQSEAILELLKTKAEALERQLGIR